MPSIFSSPPTRLLQRGRHRPTLREILNKQQGGIRKQRLNEFLVKRRKQRELEKARKRQAAQKVEKVGAPTGFTEGDIELLELFRIKPEDFDADAKARE